MVMGFYRKRRNEPHKKSAEAMPSTGFSPVFLEWKLARRLFFRLLLAAGFIARGFGSSRFL